MTFVQESYARAYAMSDGKALNKLLASHIEAVWGAEGVDGADKSPDGKDNIDRLADLLK